MTTSPANFEAICLLEKLLRADMNIRLDSNGEIEITPAVLFASYGAWLASEVQRLQPELLGMLRRADDVMRQAMKGGR